MAALEKAAGKWPSAVNRIEKAAGKRPPAVVRIREGGGEAAVSRSRKGCGVTTADAGKERYMGLPEDPMILLSYVNTQLRDHYASLNDFCAAMNVSDEELKKKLAGIDYIYDPSCNAFV